MLFSKMGILKVQALDFELFLLKIIPKKEKYLKNLLTR